MSLVEKNGSSIVRMFDQLRALNHNWDVKYGVRNGTGWISGTDLLKPKEGIFSDLLARIGRRLGSDHRKIIAASFALRYGWSSGVAIAPYLLFQCVPDIALENVCLKFSEATLFERVSLVEVRGVGSDSGNSEPKLSKHLRSALIKQAEPLIDALHDWSGFSRRGLWGQIASSWGSQFTGVLGYLNRHLEALERARAFFDVPDFIAGMSPGFYKVEHRGLTRIYHRRASCCLYYKLPNTRYCASCPLVCDEERIERNREWMERGLA